MRLIARRSRPRFVAQWRHTGALNAQVEEAFTGHALVKVFGRQRGRRARASATRTSELFEASFGAQFISGIIQPAMMFLGNLNYVAIAVVGGLRVASGTMTPRRRAGLHPVLAPVHAAAHAARVDGQRAAVGHRLGRAGVRAARRATRSRAEPADPPRRDREPRGRVELRRRVVLLRPGPPADRGPLAGGRARADRRHRGAHRRRQDHARQPASCASTSSTAGAILLDGVDISKMHATRAALEHRHGAAGHVAVSAAPSARTSRTATWRPPRSRSSRPRAPPTSTASCTRCPQGYDTVIDDEGGTVSAGEKQLITIARAFLADPTHPHPRRGHQLGRHAHRGAHPARDGGAALQPHQLRHRAPPLHHPRRRHDPGDGGGPHRRAGHPRRAARRAAAPTPRSTTPSSRRRWPRWARRRRQRAGWCAAPLLLGCAPPP